MNSKDNLLRLLEAEQNRIQKRIRRHDDVMTDSDRDALAGRREGIAFAIAQLENLKPAA